MPLTDLIRYFNMADQDGDSTLYQEKGRAAAWHRGLRLGSHFRPIVNLRDERIVGHQALLVASLADGRPLGAAEAYATCESTAAVVHFDRLCRTLHALNFLTQQRHAGGYLQMAVHPRHVQAILNQHGLVYEAILKRCGLAPQDIVLHIGSHSPDDAASLGKALVNYRLRGYRLALSAPDGTSANWPPSFVPDIAQVSSSHDCAHLAAWQDDGVSIELVGIDSGLSYQQAIAAGIVLGQGDLFGLRQADCRPTHGKGRVAYNAPSPFRSPP
ncbi:EAL domain-containing protein [Dechloromonas sp. XY25]|uniref:EAL domain-containing protein n=1 Tax=Dechloromonas hankyongensis TaxID=2908002 RepID=A0ABS9JXV5_9RHOO|nr:EAL domain-containing protein [Dechloromonas hankyongensis]MCG2575734.1 EAL domain-containing protein [Dechloromonas hankyongensis]